MTTNTPKARAPRKPKANTEVAPMTVTKDTKGKKAQSAKVKVAGDPKATSPKAAKALEAVNKIATKPKLKYAIAFPTDKYYALAEGPFEDIQEPLQVVPDRDDSLILQLTSNDKVSKAMYLWNPNKSRWIPLVKK